MKYWMTAFAIFSVAVGLAGAQTRTWSFSKDLVKGGTRFGSSVDSVSITNAGIDTLKFDTVMAELIRPVMPSWTVLFNSPLKSYYVWNHPPGVEFSNPPPKSIVVPPAQSLRLKSFALADYPYVPVAKRAATFAGGDSMEVRMIFQAALGRGRDTVIVSGLQQSSSVIRMPGFSRSPRNPDAKFFDPRGRRVGKSPVETQVPRTPVISPKN
jgi:hypothetical protein